MDSKNSSVNNSSELSHGSLKQIRQKAGPVKFEPNERWPHSRQVQVDDVRAKKVGQAAYLKSVPPDLDLSKHPSGRRGSDVRGSQVLPRKISEPLESYRKTSETIFQRQISQGRRRADSESKSASGQLPMGPPSPTLQRGSEMPHGNLRRGSQMPPDYRKRSVVPTGWDIHGRRDSQQSWPTDDRRMTQLMQRPGLLSQLLQRRYRDDQSASLRSSDQNPLRPRVQLENTYKTEPDEHFETHEVQKIIQNVLEKYLEHQEYDGPLMGQKSRTLADMIKEKVKALRYDRYKIITWVVIGQKGCNDIRIASKGIWDEDNDTYVEAFFENRSLYALGVCYGIYQE